MTINIFISHSWTYSNQYQGLLSLLNKGNLDYKNYSVPKDDPIHTAGTDKQLLDAIREQMVHCSRVLILAGVYATYSKWIDKEIQLAREFKAKGNPKKIIAIEPFASERTSQTVKDAADEIVKWNSASIINAIKTN
ncbi:MAG: TIR domain-containing protein [Succinivibrio sp.]|nr:TIR domain-containing protein [Succinivibrio sp.]